MVKFRYILSKKNWGILTLLLSLIGGYLYSSNDSTKILNDAILELWDNGNGDICSSVVSTKKGYPFISIACEMDYSSEIRKKFLDTVFSYNAILKKEDYQINKRSGIYLYKLEYPAMSGSFVYVKLFFRNSYVLYPEKLQKYKKLSLFINGVDNENDLFQWQTLGVPIAYSIIPNEQVSIALSEKISSYNQEIWLALNLENKGHDSVVENSLNIENSMNSDIMNSYLNNILSQMQHYDEKDPEMRLLAKNISGIVFLSDSTFQKNIYATRSLLKNLYTRGIAQILFTGFKSDKDVAITSGILGYKNYESTFNIQIDTTKKEIEKMVDHKIPQYFQQQSYLILTIDAQNKPAFKYLKNKIRSMEKEYIFIPMSRFPMNKDSQ